VVDKTTDVEYATEEVFIAVFFFRSLKKSFLLWALFSPPNPEFKFKLVGLRSPRESFGLFGLLTGADGTEGAASWLFAVLLEVLVGLATSFGEGETPFSHTGLRTKSFP
jgi:hypothetical protein